MLLWLFSWCFLLREPLGVFADYRYVVKWRSSSQTRPVAMSHSSNPCKSQAESLRTTPTAAQSDCLFPLDTFSLYKHYFVLTQPEPGEGCAAYLYEKEKKKKRLHILYIGYRVSPPETGERTAITVIASLTGWGALSRQEERKQWVW